MGKINEYSRFLQRSNEKPLKATVTTGPVAALIDSPSEPRSTNYNLTQQFMRTLEHVVMFSARPISCLDLTGGIFFPRLARRFEMILNR
jgi:hypothetical protein